MPDLTAGDRAALVEQLAHALSKDVRRSQHGQLCPYWTDRRRDVGLEVCNCWIVGNARADAATVVRLLADRLLPRRRPDPAAARHLE